MKSDFVSIAVGIYQFIVKQVYGCVYKNELPIYYDIGRILCFITKVYRIKGLRLRVTE